MLVAAKPAGPTSHDVVALVRRLSGTRRVGHGGTLDPFASGVLPLFLGQATRLVEYHLADGKSYRATVCFGARSSTDDLEGTLEPVEGPSPTREAVEGVLGRFRGEIEQRPPAYSAIKVAGRRAYALARAGATVELPSRRVRIDRLELTSWDATDTNRPVAVIEVDCSAGTYVRSLARDIGEAVGSAAYLGALVRTGSGPFRLEAATPLEEIREAAGHVGGLRELLLPPDAGLDALPELLLSPAEVFAASRGQFVRLTGPATPTPASSTTQTGTADGGPIRLRDAAGRLVGIGVVRGDRLVPEKVLVPATEAEAVATLAHDAPGAEDEPVGPADDQPGSGRVLLLQAEEAADADPPADVDPDPASPDDV